MVHFYPNVAVRGLQKELNLLLGNSLISYSETGEKPWLTIGVRKSDKGIKEVGPLSRDFPPNFPSGVKIAGFWRGMGGISGDPGF